MDWYAVPDYRPCCSNDSQCFESLKYVLQRTPEGDTWRIILGCRDVDRANASLSQHINPLMPLDSLTTIECMPLDLASYESTIAFAEETKRRLKDTGTINVLLLGAAVVKGQRSPKHRGKWNEDFIVNHLGKSLLWIGKFRTSYSVQPNTF